MWEPNLEALFYNLPGLINKDGIEQGILSS